MAWCSATILSQGVITGGKFVHPPLRFAFEVPSGFKLVNLPDVVAIKGPKGTLGNLTLANPQPSGSLAAAMQNYDPKGRIVFDNIENFTINGMEAVTAVTRVNTNSGSANYRAVLIRHPSGKVYEFVFLSLADLGARHDSDFQKIATSFRQINASEAAQYNKPQRIRIVTVKAGRHGPVAVQSDGCGGRQGRLVPRAERPDQRSAGAGGPEGEDRRPGRRGGFVASAASPGRPAIHVSFRRQLCYNRAIMRATDPTRR